MSRLRRTVAYRLSLKFVAAGQDGVMKAFTMRLRLYAFALFVAGTILNSAATAAVAVAATRMLTAAALTYLGSSLAKGAWRMTRIKMRMMRGLRRKTA